MPRHIQHIVGPPHHHIVAVRVPQRHIAGKIHPRYLLPGVGVAVMVAPHRPRKVRERTPDDQQPALVRLRNGLPLPVHNVHHRARQRLAHPSRPRRHRRRRPQTRPARLRLPPVVHHMRPLAAAADVGVGPPQRLRIQRLPGAGQKPQRPQIVPARRLLAVPHQHPHRRRRREYHIDAVLLNHLVEHRVVRIVRRPLPKHRRRPRHQRRIDNVAVPHHPANVRHTPEHILVFDIPEVLEMVVCAHHIPAVHMDDALRLARRAAGIEDIQRILGVHHFRRAVNRLAGQQLVKVGFAGAQIGPGQFPPPDDDGVQAVAPDHRLIGDAFQIHLAAPAVAHIAGNQRFRLGVLDAVPQRPHAEPGIDHAVDGANPRAGQHTDGPFRRQRHIDDHPVALADAQRLQPVGHPVDLLRQPRVGIDLFRAVLAQPDERRLVAPPRRQMPIQRIVGDIRLPADKPPEIRIIPLKHGIPPPEPVQILRRLRPEPLRIRHRPPIDALIIGQSRLPGHMSRRQNLPRLLQKMVNLSLLNHNGASQRIASDAPIIPGIAAPRRTQIADIPKLLTVIPAQAGIWLRRQRRAYAQTTR